MVSTSSPGNRPWHRAQSVDAVAPVSTLSLRQQQMLRTPTQATFEQHANSNLPISYTFWLSADKE
eukprot:3418047-Amphidinium_carterae.1